MGEYEGNEILVNCIILKMDNVQNLSFWELGYKNLADSEKRSILKNRWF